MTFSLLPQVTHAWRRRGRPKRVSTPGSNVRVSVFGAYRWPDGPFRFALDRGGVRTDLFLPVLEMLRQRARRTGRLVVLVSDNGSAQTSKRSTIAVWRAFPGVTFGGAQSVTHLRRSGVTHPGLRGAAPAPWRRRDRDPPWVTS